MHFASRSIVFWLFGSCILKQGLPLQTLRVNPSASRVAWPLVWGTLWTWPLVVWCGTPCRAISLL